MWLTLLGSRWVQMGLLALAMGLWVGVVTVQRNYARAQHETCVEQGKAKDAAIQKLGDQIAAQNAAVDALKAASDRKQAESAKALQNARQAAQEARSEAERLSKGIGQGLACTQATARVREGL